MRDYFETTLEPLLTEYDVRVRIDEILGEAIDRQVWIMFLDVDAVQLPLLIPVGHLPALPVSVHEFAPFVSSVVRATGAASVVFVYERPGGKELSRDDVEWVDALADAAELASVPLRGVFVCHSGGAVPVPLTSAQRDG